MSEKTITAEKTEETVKEKIAKPAEEKAEKKIPAKKPISAQKPKKQAKARQGKKKLAITKGKRKRAIARALVKEGKGSYRINKKSVKSLNNKYLIEFLNEPLIFLGNKAEKLDIEVNVHGGGMMGQLQAARTAVARGLVEYFNDEQLKQKMDSYDKYLLGDDIRRVEPKKDHARKARAKYQKSYR